MSTAVTRSALDADVVGVPELDAAEDAGLVVHHGDALEHVAEGRAG